MTFFSRPLKKHLSDLQKRPKELQERVFQKVFNIAEISKLNKDDMNAYEESLKHYRDYVNSVSTAREEGIELGHNKGKKEGIKEGLIRGKEKGLKTGKKEGIIEVALSMLDEGYSVEQVSKLTKLSMEELAGLTK